MSFFLLSVNAGSSSIKIDLYSRENFEENFSPKRYISRSYAEADKQQILNEIFESIKQDIGENELLAIGHRMVHGGPKYLETTELTDEVRQDLEQMAKYDPEHTPAALEIITNLSDYFAGVTQYACFDTAFFRELPAVASTLALPKKIRDLGVRKYGFHGLSYTYLLDKFATVAGEKAKNGRIVIAHLGSGASLAAIKNGKAVDTTMSFTPASGIIMSSRLGDSDAGIVSFLEHNADMSVDDFNNMVNKQSGLLGVSGLSASLKELIDAESENPDAALAIEMFVYQVKKTIAAYTAALGGIDSLIFSGGIGEKSSIIRHRVCEDMSYLGIELDSGRNSEHRDCISVDGAKVGVHVLPTNESVVIANEIAKIFKREGLI